MWDPSLHFTLFSKLPQLNSLACLQLLNFLFMQVEVKRTVPREEMTTKDGPKTRKIFIGGLPPSLSEGRCFLQMMKYRIHPVDDTEKVQNFR
jgi:hypothetical protein